MSGVSRLIGVSRQGYSHPSFLSFVGLSDG